MLNRVVFLSWLTLACLVVILHSLGFCERPNLWMQDFFFRLNAEFYDLPDRLNEIVLVGLDDSSLKNLAVSWPVPRNVFAKVLNKIKPLHPRVIVLDSFILGPSSFGPEDDKVLKDALKKFPKVLMPFLYSPNGELLLPYEPYQEVTSGVGSVVHHPRRDGKIHDFYPIELNREGQILGFSLAAFSAFTYQGLDLHQVQYDGQKLLLPNGERIILGNSRELPVFFYGRTSNFQYCSFSDLINGKMQTFDFQNKIVILGHESPLFHDITLTPLGLMPGFVLIANEILTLLEGQYIYIIPHMYQAMFGVLFVTLLFVLFKSLSWFLAVLMFLIVSCMVFVLSFLSFKGGIWFNFFMPWVEVALSFFTVVIAHLIRNLQMAYDEKMKTAKIAAAGEVMARFSHEIKNPLANMRSSLNLLKKNVSQESEASKWVAIFDDEVKRISQLSTQMLGFFRPQEEAKVYASVNDLIGEMAKLIASKLKEENIQLVLSLDDALPNILIAPNQIKQVVLNLMINAVDAMHDSGGMLEIKTILQNRYIQIRVEDSGPGIPKQYHQKLFKAFFTTKEQGIGLGLSISYDIVKRNGGLLEFDAAFSKGAAFNVYLPRME